MSMWGTLATAILLGGVLGAGLILIAGRIPRVAAPSLTRRIAPYVRDVGDPLGLTPLAGRAPWTDWRLVRDRWAARLGGGVTVSRKLTQAGWAIDVVTFRARQLALALIGAVVGTVGVIVAAVAGHFTLPVVLLAPLAAGGSAVAADIVLTTSAQRRVKRLTEELPTVLEFLALCLSAGEGLRDALDRVGTVGSGELTLQVRRALVLAATGSGLADALGQVARELDVAPFSRAVDHIVAAIERGAPLAHVLQSQAVDAREEGKRHLLEQAGHREVLMLLPLVFLILPLSVLFAIFPGMALLGVGF